MKELKPQVYRVNNYYDKYIGSVESLVDVIDLAKKEGYNSPDLIKILACFSDETEMIVPKNLYSREVENPTSPIIEYEFLSKKELAKAETKVRRIKNLKKRACWNCKAKLTFEDYFSTNQNLSKSRALELWESGNIEFYCCSCYRIIKSSIETERRMERLERQKEKIFKQVPRSQKEKIKFLEKEIGIKIPPVLEFGSRALPKNFGFVYKHDVITGFSLYYYDLKHVPETIRAFKSIEFLDLIGNRIKTLPEWIAELENLRYLNLLANQLTDVPESIGDLNNLQYLNLSFNNLERIPNSIKKLTSLKAIYLWANSITNLSEFMPFFKENNIRVVK
jgi:hypothetical protein